MFVLAEQFAPYVSAQLDAGASVKKMAEIVFGLIVGMIFYVAWGKATKLEQWQLIQPEKTSTET